MPVLVLRHAGQHGKIGEWRRRYSSAREHRLDLMAQSADARLVGTA